MTSRRPLPADVSIRPATTDDIPALQRFTCANPGEAWTTAPEVIVQVQLPSWLRDPDFFALVAEAGGHLVGVIAVRRDPSDPTLCFSEVLAVVPERRREYIGYNLKLHALEDARARAAGIVASEVDEHNIAMRRCNDCFFAATTPDEREQDTLITAVNLSI